MFNRSMLRFGFPMKIFKGVWYLLVAFMVTEFIVLNCIILYGVSYLSNELSQIQSPYKDTSLFEKLTNNEKIRSILTDGKKGGFVSILQETLERLYIIHEDHRQSLQWTDVDGKQLRAISFMGLDVSHSGEATYLYKRILSRKSFPYHFLIVDIGANDGLISSNSFNFIQWGWDAVLVEPQADFIKMAKINVKRYIDPGRNPPQSVKFVEAVISHEDGQVQFVRKPKTYGTESHIHVQNGKPLKEGEYLVNVQSMTVKSLTERNSIPSNFGILSIDAEGYGAEILRQWLSASFRPAYIIFERIHQQEALQITIRYLNQHKYQFIETKGWNLIFEHQP